jgi:hypothetical protein
MNAEAWKKEIKAKLNEGVQAVVLLLPGQKGKNSLYDDIKRFLLQEYAIPSQVVLCNTIQRGKNLRSIVNKVSVAVFLMFCVDSDSDQRQDRRHPLGC